MDHRTENRDDREGDFFETIFFSAFLMAALLLATDVARVSLGVSDERLVLVKACMTFALCLYGELAVPPDPAAPVATAVIICIFGLTLYMVPMVVALVIVQPHFPLLIQTYMVMTGLYCLFCAGAAALTGWAWRRI